MAGTKPHRKIKDNPPKRAKALRKEIDSLTYGVPMTNARSTNNFTLHVAKLDSFNNDSVLAIIAELVQDAGLTGTEIGWEQIDRAAAEGILSDVLHRDIPHRTERMPKEAASRIASDFLNLFQASPVLYFTTRWINITQATFDAGVVALDGAYAGMLWGEGEE